MGLLDSLGGVLKGAFGEAEAAALPALLNAVLAKTQYHDLNGLVSALQQGGLGPQVTAQVRSRQRASAGLRPAPRPAGRPDAGAAGQVPAGDRGQGIAKRNAAAGRVVTGCKPIGFALTKV